MRFCCEKQLEFSEIISSMRNLCTEKRSLFSVVIHLTEIYFIKNAISERSFSTLTGLNQITFHNDRQHTKSPPYDTYLPR